MSMGKNAMTPVVAAKCSEHDINGKGSKSESLFHKFFGELQYYKALLEKVLLYKISNTLTTTPVRTLRPYVTSRKRAGE